MLCSEGASIKGSSVFVERCQAMLTRLQEVCPQLDTDGLQNIWIIKPGAKSRGRGEAALVTEILTKESHRDVEVAVSPYIFCTCKNKLY